MPQNWKTYKLGEVVDLKQGLAINKGTNHLLCEKGDDSIPLFKIRDLLNDTIEHYVKASEVPVQCIANEDDLIYTRTGQVGHVIRGKIGCIHNNCFKVIPDNRLDRGFLYHFLRNPVIRKYANDIASGSVQKDLNHGAFKSIEIDVPDNIQEQKSIASILSALDDKIENNLAMNKTLEEMAMALYKHWFVDFGPFQEGEFVPSELGDIPKGWEVREFQSLYELRKGLSYKSKFYSDDGLPMINLKCFDRNGGFRQDGIKYYAGDFKKTHEVEHGDLMIAMTDLTQDRAVLGSPILCPKIQTKSKVIASLDIGILKQKALKEINLNLYFNYTMRTNRYHEYILGYGNGSTVMHLDKKGVLEYQALLPPKNVLQEFENVVSSFREMESSNLFEIQSLTTLRDTLLPKLISGEVRVKDAEQTVANAL